MRKAATHKLSFNLFLRNLLTDKDPRNIETSQLICNVNQLTGFYMMGNIAC